MPLLRGLRPTPSSGRGDIQGLRALAVSLVVVNHVFGRPDGGFLGVDVFFVISGFLITGLLLADREKRGQLRYADFYRRRVRRLLPAAVLVIAITVVASMVLFLRSRSQQVLVDGVWALGFSSNWRFAAVGTDYFAADGFVSPLQHFWSLAVEEQFYLVWPTLLAIGLTLARGSRAGAALMASAVTVGSFAYSLGHSADNPTWAYFSTFDRAWELGAGALLAVAAPLLVHVPTPVRVVLGWLGTAGIAVAVVVVGDVSGFPAPGAALAVGSTLLVLAAGTPGDQPWLYPLNNPVSRYVGDISYSLYLWHFPVVVLLAVRLDDDSTTYRAAALGLALLLAVLSFHLLEDPVRRSDWLEPRHARGPVRHPGNLLTRWLVVGAAGAVLLVVAALNPEQPSVQQVLSARPSSEAGRGESEAAYLSDRLRESLDLTEFPPLEPPLSALGEETFFRDLEAQGCSNVLPADVDRCSFGSSRSDRVAVITGDSFAMAYAATVRRALVPLGWQVRQLTLQECPAWYYERLRFDGRAYPECDQYRAFVRERIRELSPDLVFLSTNDGDISTLASGATGAAAIQELRQGVSATLEALKSRGTRLVVLAPPPGTQSLQVCATRGAQPRDCAKSPDSIWKATQDVERSAATAVGGTYLDTSGWFCSGGACPAFVGTTAVFYDGAHVTHRYAEELAPVLREALVQEGVPLRR